MAVATYNRSLIACLVIFAVTNVAFSLQCYECIEEKGKSCVDHRGVVNGKVECSTTHVCVRHYLPAAPMINDQSAKYISTCGPSNYCEINITYIEAKHGINFSTRICSVCTIDLCNSSNTLTITTFLLVFVLFFKCIFNVYLSN